MRLNQTTLFRTASRRTFGGATWQRRCCIHTRHRLVRMPVFHQRVRQEFVSYWVGFTFGM